jgi:hypothetical protein
MSFFMGVKFCLSLRENNGTETERKDNMLRKEFGRKREEVIEGWRKLYDEKIHNLYSSPNIIRVIKSMRMSEACDMQWEMRNMYTILIGKPEAKKTIWET